MFLFYLQLKHDLLKNDVTEYIGPFETYNDAMKFKEDHLASNSQFVVVQFPCDQDPADTDSNVVYSSEYALRYLQSRY